ncbi:hypothetical protein L8106_07836 [Lyngbya sp. PCC 8106]|nr:hypothetical protein L8106_07836 [Lyngbya sp. PCC 8106]
MINPTGAVKLYPKIWISQTVKVALL